MITLLQQGCPKLQEGISFPYLHTAALSELDKKILLYTLKEEAKKMFDELVKLRLCFLDWIEKNVPLDKLKRITEAIIDTPTCNHNARTSISDMINAAESHQKLTQVIWKFITWFNCDLLNIIVNHSSEQLKLQTELQPLFAEKFQLYEEKRANYCKRKIFECPVLLTSEQMPTCTDSSVLCLILDENSMSNMTDIDLFLGKLAALFKIEKHNLILRFIGEGCLELVFLLLPFAYEKIFSLNRQQLEVLAMLGVTDVSTGDTCSYKSISTLLLDVQYHSTDPDLTDVKNGE